MLRDLTESIAEIIYLNEMDRNVIEGYDSWDTLAENIKESFIQVAEEILDIVDDESLETDIDLVLDDWTE